MDLEVSTLCLGTMHFGSRDDKATSYAMLDQYVEGPGVLRELLPAVQRGALPLRTRVTTTDPMCVNNSTEYGRHSLTPPENPAA